MVLAELEKLQSAPLLQFPRRLPEVEWLAEHRRLELACRPGVDAAVRMFARNGRWPALAGNEAYFLQQRLAWGMMIAGVLASPDSTGDRSVFPPPPPAFDLGEQLEWLLLAAWHDRGVEYWMSHQAILVKQHHATKGR